MNLKRRNVLTAISASFLALFGQAAVAAVVPLIKPTSLGQVVIYRNKKFTCIKKGKLLVWDRGVAIKPTPTPKPTPSATASNPSAKPTASASALTFVAKSDEIVEGSSKVIEVKPANAASISVAVTRVNGAVVVLSAVCTHQGCVVEAAKSQLECPCHGSSFNFTNGNINQGPARAALHKYVASESAGSIYITL